MKCPHCNKDDASFKIETIKHDPIDAYVIVCNACQMPVSIVPDIYPVKSELVDIHLKLGNIESLLEKLSK
ncbi:MAG: hypothetical protein ACRCR9_02760 [Chitinophagaceae bacterium]